MKPLTLSLIVLMGTTGLAHAQHTQSDSLDRLDKNICDELYENSAAQEVVESCREKQGTSEWFQAYQEQQTEQRREREEQEKQEREESRAQAAKKEELRDAIEEKKFSKQEIQDHLGIPLDIVAQEIIFNYDSFENFEGTETETVTSAHHVCRKLGFKKAKQAEIQKEQHDGQEMSGGKALYFRTKSSNLGQLLGFSEKDINLKVWKWDGFDDDDNIDKEIRLYKSVTCVKSSIEDNELMEAIALTTELVGEDHEPSQNQPNDDVHVDDSSRRTASESEFSYSDSGEDNILYEGAEGSTR